MVNISKKGTSNISFQLILDSKSILLSSAPDGRIRANINQLDEHQLRNIVEGIADAGPEVQELFLELVRELAVNSAEATSEMLASGLNHKLLEV